MIFDASREHDADTFAHGYETCELRGQTVRTRLQLLADGLSFTPRVGEYVRRPFDADIERLLDEAIKDRFTGGVVEVRDQQ